MATDLGKQAGCSCDNRKEPYPGINVTDIRITKLSNNPSIDNERTDNLIGIADAIQDKGIREILGDEYVQNAQKQLEDLVQLYKSYNKIEPLFKPVPFDPIPDPDFDVFLVASFLPPLDDPAEVKEFALNDPGPLTGEPPGPPDGSDLVLPQSGSTQKPLIVTLENGTVVELPGWLKIARRRRQAEQTSEQQSEQPRGQTSEQPPKQIVKKMALKETDGTLASLHEQSDWLMEQVKLLEGKER